MRRGGCVYKSAAIATLVIEVQQNSMVARRRPVFLSLSDGKVFADGLISLAQMIDFVSDRR